MRHLKTILAAGLLAGPIWMGPALAEGARKAPVTRAEAEAYAPATPWTGCYVQAEGGMAGAHDSLHAASTSFFASDTSVFGGFYGVGGGCDLQVAKKFVIGLFGDYDKLVSSGGTFTVAGLSSTYTLDRQWSFGGRGGYLLTPSTLFYGLVAYSQLDNVHASVAVGSKTITSASVDFGGWQLGTGLEQRIIDGWSIKGEYRYGMYDSETFHQAIPVLNSTVEPREHLFKAALVYKFPVGLLSNIGDPLK